MRRTKEDKKEKEELEDEVQCGDEQWRQLKLVEELAAMTDMVVAMEWEEEKEEEQIIVVTDEFY